jgi:hypothetical protein
MMHRLAWLLVFGVAGCLPPNLDKYRSQGKGAEKSTAGAQRTDGVDDDNSLSPFDDKARLPGPPLPHRHQASTQPAAKQQRPEERAQAPARATIYAVDKQTFRFALREGDVWDSALNVLLRNYNLTVIDKQSGIISTEWDSFYLNGAVYRNKLSMRISRSGSGVDMLVHNNVERLRDAAQAAGTVGAVWLPAPDPANEVGRIVQNMALMLGQPPPVLPPSAVAKAQTLPGEIAR